MRTVLLRDERTGADLRVLWAQIDETGQLSILGHDLGPGTAPASDDGEYEWCHTYAPPALPALASLLEARPGEDLLDLLERRWTGARSYELERRLRESNVPRRSWRWP